MSEWAFFWVGVLLFSSVGRKFRGFKRKGVKWGSPNNIYSYAGGFEKAYLSWDGWLGLLMMYGGC